MVRGRCSHTVYLGVKHCWIHLRFIFLLFSVYNLQQSFSTAAHWAKVCLGSEGSASPPNTIEVFISIYSTDKSNNNSFWDTLHPLSPCYYNQPIADYFYFLNLNNALESFSKWSLEWISFHSQCVSSIYQFIKWVKPEVGSNKVQIFHYCT